ncbi:hypothetical protein [Micromonospora sp. NPDC005174]|uniref:hypothetical protein n=1 Tax=unclassified Micromonospora TaxID=2617518 RepID=UPI0033A25BB6
MFELILSIALFVLTVAVVGLFAMMGELSSRVPQEDVVDVATPIDNAALGTAPQIWPDDITHLATREFAALVVLSTSCSSCRRIAAGATGQLSLPPDVAVIVPAPSLADGQQFVAESSVISEFPHSIDVGGEWLTKNLAVDISPSVLVFNRGALVTAHTFSSAAALNELLDRPVERDREDSHA